jgi:MscS family membrane protein
MNGGRDKRVRNLGVALAALAGSSAVAVSATAGPAAAAPESRGAAASELSGAAARAVTDWLNQSGADWANGTFLGVELWRFVTALVVLLLVLLALAVTRWLVRAVGQRLMRHLHGKVQAIVVESAVRPAMLVMGAVGAEAALLPVLVRLPPWVQGAVSRLCFAAVVLAVIWFLYRLVEVLDIKMREAMARHGDGGTDSNAAVALVRKTVRVIVILLGAMVVGQVVFGLNISALLASAGIVGVAVALAAQDTLANMFASYVLLLDRPFKIGESIRVGDTEGVVEGMGLRSTRLRTPDGSQVSVPNKVLVEAKIENLGRKPHLRRVLNVGVARGTPTDKVQRAVAVLKEILKNHRGMMSEFPPRVYFTELKDSALNLQAVVWFHPADYWEFQRWNEEVNLEILRRFGAEGIELALPVMLAPVKGS